MGWVTGCSPLLARDRWAGRSGRRRAGDDPWWARRSDRSSRSGTTRGPIGTARVVAAARRRMVRVDGLEHLDGTRRRARTLVRGARDGGQQVARVGVLRVGQHVGGRPVLHDAAEVHDRDVAGHVAHHGQVVRDEQDREAQLALQLAHQVEHGALDRDVERGRDLVGDEHVGPAGQSAGQGDPLTLPAREMRGVRPASASGRGGRARAAARPRRGARPGSARSAAPPRCDSPMVMRGSSEE